MAVRAGRLSGRDPSVFCSGAFRLHWSLTEPLNTPLGSAPFDSAQGGQGERERKLGATPCFVWELKQRPTIRPKTSVCARTRDYYTTRRDEADTLRVECAGERGQGRRF
jgi:hypothetical protein